MEDKKDMFELDGAISAGKQFDIEVKLPEDPRNAVFGIVKDAYGEPIADAVVKLVEVERKLGKKELKPVSHTFTDKNGEFVFGPLCPNKSYSIEIWATKVKHEKICHICKHKGECLKGKKIECDKYEEDDDKPQSDCPCPLLKSDF